MPVNTIWENMPYLLKRRPERRFKSQPGWLHPVALSRRCFTAESGASSSGGDSQWSGDREGREAAPAELQLRDPQDDMEDQEHRGEERWVGVCSGITRK